MSDAIRILTGASTACAILPIPAWADTVISTPTAATAPSATTVDLTNTANILLSLAAAAVTAAIPILIPFVLKRLGVANNADLSAKLATAADAAAGAAYQYALQHEGGLARVDVQNAAVAHGVTYLTSEMQPLLDTLSVTPARASAMVTARLGTLLAGDPSVTAGAPSQTPVPVTIPAPPPVHVVAPPPVVLTAMPVAQAGVQT